MRLLLFGQIRDSAEHLHDTEIISSARSVRELMGWLCQSDADLARAFDRAGLRVAVDQCFVDFDAAITPQSEVAFMSPLSGG
jgi:molybdopterin synthase sulfur carrier subunit